MIRFGQMAHPGEASRLAVTRPRSIHRAMLVVALMLGVGFLAFEGALHSVHHLGEAGETASCPLAAMAGHALALAPTATLAAPVPPVLGDVAVETIPSAVSMQPIGAHQGRAPPASPSA
jgi:hypothetical protein